MKGLLCACLLTGYCVSASAQDAPPISPDRGSITNGPALELPQHFEIDMGLDYTASGDTKLTAYPSSLIRYGFSKEFELRVAMPVYNTIADGEKGWGDSAVTAKIALGKFMGFDAAVIPGFTVPTGKTAFSTGRYDPNFQFCLAKSLSPTMGFGCMLAAYFPTIGDERDSQFQATAVVSVAATKTMSVFFEGASTFSRLGSNIHVLHSGASWLLSNDTMFDVHYGIGLNSGAPDAFVGVGFSVRY